MSHADVKQFALLLFGISFLSTTLFAATHVWFLYVAMRHLESRHPKIWAELTNSRWPFLWLNVSKRRLLKLLAKPEREKLGDVAFNEIALYMRILDVLFCASLIGFIAAVVALTIVGA